MTKTEKQKMLAGELYRVDDELIADLVACSRWTLALNALSIDRADERDALLRAGLGRLGKDCFIRPGFQCDYGYNIFLGDGVALNFNCVILDVARVEIGSGAQVGPNVQIYTADHPRDAKSRAQHLESGRPVRIGENVWIGGGAIILPGVVVGNDAIIGAGSVVTRNVPDGATVFGNPARPRAHAP